MQRPTNIPAETVVQAVTHLGPLEAKVMEIAWQQGQVSVREMLETLSHEQELAYTTVMTVMARLATKGLLKRTLKGKTYLYEPAGTAQQFLEETARQRVHGL